MTLIKTSILNGIAVIIKMLTLLGVNKVLAIYVGPAGYAAIGQFQNAVQVITTFASGAINTGVTKYTAEYYEDEGKQRAVWRAAGTIALIGSLTTGILIIIFRQYLSQWFLKNTEYGGVFGWFGATLVFFVFNSLLLAILNGKKDIRRYVVANIFGSLFAFAATSLMSIRFGLYGALIALAVYQSLAFFVTFWLCVKADWFGFKFLVGAVDKGIAINLAKYTAIALVTAVCSQSSQIFIRNHIGETYGWISAGHWEAMWRLSTAYLMMVTTTLSVYYLPRLSELKWAKEIKKEIYQGYKIIIPVTMFGSLMIYIFRDLVVKIVFTEEFYPMRDLFAWQMIGDNLKIASWLISFIMLGRSFIKECIISEILFALCISSLSFFLVNKYGANGACLAYAISYLLYWIGMYVFVFKKISFMESMNSE